METVVESVEKEMLLWSGYPEETKERKRSFMASLKQHVDKNPGSFIQKIVWDQEGGYPELAWGYVQYTVRPYRQGYGCDGTTDQNIHLIAATLAKRSGLDYLQIYRTAYTDNTGDWIPELFLDRKLLQETVIPEGCNLRTWVLALRDLYEINNRSLVQKLEEQLEPMYPQLHEWWNLFEEVRKETTNTHKEALCA